MDEMKIESKFIAKKVSKAIRWFVLKRFGYDVDIMLNGFRTTVIDGKTHVHLDVDFEIEKDELDKIMDSIGL